MGKVFIIAEAGVNHNGSLELAKLLVEKAAEAGADAVKFQTFKTENLVCRNAKKAEYQMATTKEDETQFEMLKRLELTEKMYEELLCYCREKGILFLSTPYDIESLKLLLQYGLKIIKIPSGEITNYPYLRAVGESGVRVILSTGMSELKEVKEGVSVLKKFGTKDITVLHCNTEYPTPMRDVNLLAMQTLKKELDLPVGYSDHTLGIEIPMAAVALGAIVIEKHFTLDKNMEGPDHKASLEPEELAQMIKGIRNIEQAMGSSEKTPSVSEKKNISVVRKSIVAKCYIKQGEIFTEDNLTVKRPGTGMSPMKWEELLGKKAEKNYEIDDMIEEME